MEPTVSNAGSTQQPDISEYIAKRVDDQLAYFDSSALKNQRAYKRLKSTSIACNVLTTMTIALAFTVSEQYKVYMGILALVLSTIVLATYQWEEFQNYGAKWEKFRLVAEQLKSEKFLFLNRAGHYSDQDEHSSLMHVRGDRRADDSRHRRLILLAHCRARQASRKAPPAAIREQRSSDSDLPHRAFDSVDVNHALRQGLRKVNYVRSSAKSFGRPTIPYRY